jgi:hypothetical protein
LLPRIELHGSIFFRYLRCPHRREDALQEMRAVAWKWYVAAVARGKDPARFVATLATYAARHVRSGRKLCGQEPSRDVLSPVAGRKHDFVVTKLPDWETSSANPLIDALTDNTRSPVPEQVMFRCDLPAWLNTLGERNRRVVEDLMRGEGTLDVARRHGLSPGRISQLRRAFLKRWQAFCGECQGGRATTPS